MVRYRLLQFRMNSPTGADRQAAQTIRPGTRFSPVQQLYFQFIGKIVENPKNQFQN
jgi:hypothetical protein